MLARKQPGVTDGVLLIVWRFLETFVGSMSAGFKLNLALFVHSVGLLSEPRSDFDFRPDGNKLSETSLQVFALV